MWISTSRARFGAPVHTFAGGKSADSGTGLGKARPLLPPAFALSKRVVPLRHHRTAHSLFDLVRADSRSKPRAVQADT